VAHPNDNFNYALGRTKAAGRLVQAVKGTGKTKSETEVNKWYKSENGESFEDFFDRVVVAVDEYVNVDRMVF
jgi:hypothetical protein